MNMNIAASMSDRQHLIDAIASITAERDSLRQRCQVLSEENKTLKALVKHKRAVVLSDEEEDDEAEDAEENCDAPVEPTEQPVSPLATRSPDVVEVTAPASRPPPSSARRRAVVTSEDESEEDDESEEEDDGEEGAELAEDEDPEDEEEQDEETHKARHPLDHL